MRRRPFRLTMLGALIVLVARGCHPVLVHAAPPPVGSEDWETMAPYRHEIERAEADSGARCCDWGDGRPVTAERTTTGWRVRFRDGNGIGAPAGVWLDVSATAMVRSANPAGVPIAWWRRVEGRDHGGYVVCLWPGPEF